MGELSIFFDMLYLVLSLSKTTDSWCLGSFTPLRIATPNHSCNPPALLRRVAVHGCSPLLKLLKFGAASHILKMANTARHSQNHDNHEPLHQYAPILYSHWPNHEASLWAKYAWSFPPWCSHIFQPYSDYSVICPRQLLQRRALASKKNQVWGTCNKNISRSFWGFKLCSKLCAGMWFFPTIFRHIRSYGEKYNISRVHKPNQLLVLLCSSSGVTSRCLPVMTDYQFTV